MPFVLNPCVAFRCGQAIPDADSFTQCDRAPSFITTAGQAAAPAVMVGRVTPEACANTCMHAHEHSTPLSTTAHSKVQAMGCKRQAMHKGRRLLGK
jgi:hypothetical protein